MYNKKDSETNKESSNASAVSVMKGGKQEDFVDDLANSPGLRDVWFCYILKSCICDINLNCFSFLSAQIVVRGSTTPNIHNYRN